MDDLKDHGLYICETIAEFRHSVKTDFGEQGLRENGNFFLVCIHTSPPPSETRR